jgi:hypothetical protein
MGSGEGGVGGGCCSHFLSGSAASYSCGSIPKGGEFLTRQAGWSIFSLYSSDKDPVTKAGTVTEADSVG